jgi:hypothetical protein
MENAYAGNPSTATVAEGKETLAKLAEMIATEVVEAIAK